MALQVVWAKCSVTDPTSGQDTILSRGELVPDFVDEFTRFALTSIGAAMQVERPGDPVAVPAPVRLSEHPPLGSQQALAEQGTLAGEASAGGQDAFADAPARTATKETWVAYAETHGMTRDEARGMTRDALAEEFGR